MSHNLLFTQAASVAELESTPSLVTNPINSVTTDTWPYSQSVADLYSTTADNFVATAYELNPLKDYKFTVTMPENSTFEFPGIYASPLKTCYSNITSGYTNARLTIPANYTGKVEIPLVLHTITGTGKVLLNNEEVDIGSAEMTSKINQRDNFIDVEFIGNNNAVQIIYLLNPRIVKMNYCNVLSLTGSNLSGISAKLITLQ